MFIRLDEKDKHVKCYKSRIIVLNLLSQKVEEMRQQNLSLDAP